MKGQRKRSLAPGIVLIMIVSIIALSLSGCGSGSQETSASSSPEAAASGTVAATTAEEPKVYPQFSVWIGTDEKKSPEITELQKLFKEKLGFDFTVQSRQGDLMTALNIKLNSGSLEDMAVIYKDDVAINAFIKSGQIQEVEQYYKMPEKYPNLAKVPEEVLSYCKSTDGKLWYLPGWYAQEMEDPWPGWAATAWWPRTDLVEKVGMKMEDLATIEGLEKYMREAAKQKDASGKAVIPLGFILNEGNTLNDEENIIFSTFGVDMARGYSKMPGVRKDGSNYIFSYDDPHFKEAFQWINRMYREGLIDVEVPTQKVERYKEKVNAGRYGMLAGTIWKAELNNSWAKLSGPTDPVWYFQPMKDPAVSGVSAPGAVQYVNPYPASAIFISKSTKNAEAVLRFLDWCQESDPIRQQEINEGPVGINWHWNGEPLGEWDFTPEYGAERNSGDQARVDRLTPQMWYLGTYSKKWYPWWTNAIGSDKPIGMSFSSKYTAEISNNFKIVRNMHSYDAVPAPVGGVIEKYMPTLNAVYIEYRARLIMAKSDAEFEATWGTFRDQLETRAHWSEMKEEWNTEYQKYLKEKTDF